MLKVRKIIYALLILILLGKSGLAQSVSTLMGARGAGMGYATATLRDESSLLNNVGGLPGSQQPSVSFAFDARPGLVGANRMSAIFTTPAPVGVLGLGLFRFGDDLYSEQIISAGYSNQFGIASLGLKLNYIQYRADGFATRNAVSLNFGGITQITPRIMVGAYIVNLNQPRVSTLDKERIPVKMVAGVSFKPTDRIMLAAELEKDLAFGATVKAGAEYQVNKKVYCRTGFNLHPDAAFLGLGFLTKRIKIDYALQYNSDLATAHQVTVIYHREKKNSTRGHRQTGN